MTRKGEVPLAELAKLRLDQLGDLTAGVRWSKKGRPKFPSKEAAERFAA
jgi:hypothetical protein